MKSACAALLVMCNFVHLHGQSFSPDSLATASLQPVAFSAASWGDYDGDGDLDFVLCGQDSASALIALLFENNGAGAFAATDAGLTPVQLPTAAWADYDNDGDLDLLVAGRSSPTEKSSKVYRNDGGQFTDIGAPLQPVSRAAAGWGDYDDDGLQDILLLGKDIAGAAVTKIYHNDGSDNFSELAIGLPGLHSGDAIWFDFDNDGQLDFLLTGSDNGGLPVTKVYRSTGNGNFEAADLDGFANSSAAVGDIDLDNDADLLVAGITADSLTAVKIYTNDGNANFTDAGIQLAGLHSGSAALGDMDNDGDLDVLLTGKNANGIASTLVYRNDGQNAFANVDFGLNGSTDGFADFADFDDDADLDLFIAGRNTDGVATAVIYANTPPVQNTAPQPPPDLTATLTDTTLVLTWGLGSDAETAAGLTYNLKVGTVPGGGDILSPESAVDGRRQIVAYGNMGFRRSWTLPIDRVRALHAVYWSVQSIDNGFAGSAFANEVFVPDFTKDVQASQAIAAVNASSVDWGDFDNDGDLDLLLTGQNLSNNRIARIYRNDRNSNFASLNAGLDGVAAGDAVWGDYNNDGNLDIVLTGFNAANQETARIYRNNGTGTFADIEAGLIGVFISSADWGDYDNDGDLDLLYAGVSVNAATSLIYRNDNGNFVALPEMLTGIRDGSVTWSDFDNDGFLDILVAGLSENDGGVTRIYRNDGNDRFSETGSGLPGVTSASAAVGDYDNDGDTDILIAGSSPNGRLANILRNDGRFSFTEIDAGVPGVSNGSVAFGDLDNDGALDILLAGFDAQFNRVAMVYHNDGNDTFSDINAFLDGVIFGQVAVADYDNDTDLDIVLTGSSLTSRVATIYRNNVATPSDPPQPPTALTASFTDTSLTFNWEAGTQQTGLSYNLRVGATPGASNILPAMSQADGYRQIVRRGNAGHRTTATIKIDDILNHPGVYWSVQSVDNSFEGSEFAAEASFAPQIIAVKDVPNDEGGKVTIKWQASALDHDVNKLTSYSVWRALPETPASLREMFREIPSGSDVTTNTGLTLRFSTVAGETYAWEWLATLPAHRNPVYSYTAETLFDSMATTAGKHFFLLSAHTDDANVFFDSLPDSGFSIDNLPPQAPTNLAGALSDGVLALSWRRNHERDLKTYRLYQRSERDATFLDKDPFATTRDTAFALTDFRPTENLYFAVVAQDSAGNLSEPSNEIGFLVTAVADNAAAVPTSFSLFQNYPNPFNPATQIRFALPEASHVTLEIFDLIGRRVEILADQAFQAGFHSVTFDAGSLPTGTYFYKLYTGNFVDIRKMVLVR